MKHSVTGSKSMFCALKAVLSNIRCSILPLYVQFTEISDAQPLASAYISCCLALVVLDTNVSKAS